MEFNEFDIKNEPLSIYQMKQLAQYLNFDDVEIAVYNDIKTWDSNNPKIILIQSKYNPYVGHYVLIYDNVFFDFSGNKNINIFHRFNLDNQDFHKLYDYFKKFKNSQYLNKRFQFGNNSNVCGHSVLIKLWFRNMSVDDFENMIIRLKKQYNYKNYNDLIVDMLRLICHQSINQNN